MIDDAKTIEDVGISKPLLHELLIVRLCERVLRAIVVFVRRVQKLLSPGSHGREGNDGGDRWPEIRGRAGQPIFRKRFLAVLASLLFGKR